MDEISNKTLATLLVVAIVISLAGTFFAMRGVTTVTNYVTGHQTDQGKAKVNITAKTSISLTQALVSFGGGYRNETCLGSENIEINMSSNDSTAPDCWIVDPAGTFTPSDLRLENDGNVYVNVTINSTVAANYFDSCTFSTISGGDSDYSWAAKEVEGTSCNDGSLITADTPFDGTHQFMCGNFTYEDGHDELNITINLDVPSGPTGTCSADIDFTAARSTA